MLGFHWDPNFVAEWAVKFAKLEDKLTNEKIEYLRQYYYSRNKFPTPDEVEAIAKEWNIDDWNFNRDLYDWFFGRFLADHVLEYERYLARRTGA